MKLILNNDIENFSKILVAPLGKPSQVQPWGPHSHRRGNKYITDGL
jgi:hypothetical protein